MTLFWWPPNEAVRVRLVSRVEHHLAASQDGLALAEMDHGPGQQADAGVAMLLVVPVKELLTEGAAVLECRRSDPGTPDGTSGCGTGLHKAGCESW
jgi:hypothetical protein